MILLQKHSLEKGVFLQDVLVKPSYGCRVSGFGFRVCIWICTQISEFMLRKLKSGLKVLGFESNSQPHHPPPAPKIPLLQN